MDDSRPLAIAAGALGVGLLIGWKLNSWSEQKQGESMRLLSTKVDALIAASQAGASMVDVVARDIEPIKDPILTTAHTPGKEPPKAQPPRHDGQRRKITRVVMTGGPCGGKSSCLTFIENHLQELGYTVYMVPEASTLLKISGCGFPVSASREIQLAWEESKMRLQIALEDLFVQLSSASGEKTVILNDRGLLDSKFFAGEEDFADILFNNHWSEETLLGRYDLVIHLVTAAIGAETFYTTEGNVARWETPAQAAEQDNALKSCWMGHRHHYTVDNSDTFQKKVRKATKIICEEIGVAKPSAYKITFLLKGEVPAGLKELDKQFLHMHGIKDDVQFHKLTTTFLSEGADGSNKVLRRRERNGMSTFLLTTEIKDEKGNRVLLEDPLRRAMYQSLQRGKDPNIAELKVSADLPCSRARVCAWGGCVHVRFVLMSAAMLHRETATYSCAKTISCTRWTYMPTGWCGSWLLVHARRLTSCRKCCS
jgi:hypothetical protein